jgi:hypothetical protein
MTPRRALRIEDCDMSRVAYRKAPLHGSNNKHRFSTVHSHMGGSK